MQQNFIQNIKDFFIKTKDKFKKLETRKKIAIGIAICAIILATIFSIKYTAENKYGTLFSGLDTTDAAAVTKVLEDKGVETKIDGNTIYVPKAQVDRLRLELSSTITNGSKGFELMDEGSSLSMTDEEFKIKKLRMLQGELEKTIKTFPAIEDARVHITQGEESVFSKANKEGKAAVYVVLKYNQELDETQIKSIISLVSASTINIPKNNIEVIDQNMNLLSEGIYDENGNSIKGVGLSASRTAERELSEELEKSVLNMLEPIFGKGKVKATVNANLNFDTVEKNEIKIDPDKVIKNEVKKENLTSDKNQTGSPVDNNMSNTTQNNSASTTSKEEQIEYEVGRTETTTITSSGQVKKIAASVAIDGVLSDDVLMKVQDMVQSALGIDTARGDLLSVVDMEFATASENVFGEDNVGTQLQKQRNMLITVFGGAIILLTLIFIVILIIIGKKKNKVENVVEEDIKTPTDYIAEIVRAKEIEKAKLEEKELSLEDEVKFIASQSPEEVAELIKVWLND